MSGNRKKKRKIRVALRKNRQNRTRQGDLTRQIMQESEEFSEDLPIAERISGKGDLTRRRTVISVDDDGTTGSSDLVIDVDESNCLTGRVISAIGLNAIVQSDDGRRFECTIRRLVRTIARDERNAVVAGDRVVFQPLNDKQGVIERVDPRRGTISRGSQRREHIIVANVDQVMIVASADDPPLKPNLIDRFLVSAEKGEVGSIICINKVDLIDPVMIQPIVGVYAALGYEVVLTSTTNNTGIERLRSLLRDRETVLTGQSGVGKSSLLNAIQPNFDLKTSEISDWSHKGRHTTRRAALLELDFGGWVVDTPGLRQLELWDVIPEEVEAYFIEFRSFVPFCKYPDCTHTHEDHCGVKQAVERGQIAQMRYESFLRIVEG